MSNNNKERILLPVPSSDKIIDYLQKNQQLSKDAMLNQILAAMLDHCQRGCQHCGTVFDSAFGVSLGEIQDAVLR